MRLPVAVDLLCPPPLFFHLRRSPSRPYLFQQSYVCFTFPSTLHDPPPAFFRALTKLHVAAPSLKLLHIGGCKALRQLHLRTPKLAQLVANLLFRCVRVCLRASLRMCAVSCPPAHGAPVAGGHRLESWLESVGRRALLVGCVPTDQPTVQ